MPQGSILGPVLFNLYVTDISEHISSTCLQYADDTSIYKHCRPNKINECAVQLSSDLSSLAKWSENNNLVFNETKTKTIMFATPMFSKHHLDNNIYNIKHLNQTIERVKQTKLLGITFNEKLQ